MLDMFNIGQRRHASTPTGEHPGIASTIVLICIVPLWVVYQLTIHLKYWQK